MYPTIEINTAGILQNLHTLKALAAEQGIRISMVTKGFVGYAPLVKFLTENGADSICEAHFQNLKKYEDYEAEKWMIRPPMISQAAEVVRYADVSLNSEYETIRALSAEAIRQGRKHKVVIMTELGETREGIMPADLVPLCEAITKLSGIELYGIGNNLSCYSEIIPDDENMGLFTQLVHDVEAAVGFKLPIVSGGNTSSVYKLQRRELPKEINHLRIGEAIIIGNIACYNEPVRGGSSDNLTLSAEIIEIKEKPSAPYGSRVQGVVPAAQDPRFPDRGIRKRALIAVGKQDVDIYHLKPHDAGIEVLGGCSDCFVADITDCEKKYSVGDVVQFTMNYYSMLSGMSSEYIEKILV
ncbi:MAG: alanine/ornithine racemase family PLP-dependent enzyme [Clostridiales Family XIII bacterium]|jgi:predicted amino acid racemase|nr:alanine/ornithine racemase family PLP-dependent enzyme [Clostridiales Family XIII bacterium]